MKKKLLILLIILSLSACSYNKTYEKNKTFLGTIKDKYGSMVLLLNTEIYLTCVDRDKEDSMINKAQELFKTYHIMLDSHHEYQIPNLYTLNNERYLKDESDILINALEFSIEMSKLTKGYFNPTIGNLSKLYDGMFVNFDYENDDPNKESIDNALNSVIPYDLLEEYIIINKNEHTITLLDYENTNYTINLGAIAKGYITDIVYSSLREYNSSFLLSAGSSSVISYINKEEGISWNVGYRDPKNENEMLFAYNIDDKAVSSSGRSQQYYINRDGIIRSHILNPYTGYSENYYEGLILMSDKNTGAILDSLSTALYNINDMNMIKEIIKNVEEKYSIKIDYSFHFLNNDILFTNHFKSLLMEEYTSNKINITIGD